MSTSAGRFRGVAGETVRRFATPSTLLTVVPALLLLGLLAFIVGLVTHRLPWLTLVLSLFIAAPVLAFFLLIQHAAAGLLAITSFESASAVWGLLGFVLLVVVGCIGVPLCLIVVTRANSIGELFSSEMWIEWLLGARKRDLLPFFA